MRPKRAPDDDVMFHPPPGWPPEPPPGMPPPGWVIPPGWRPAPSLPPAPDDWAFWVPADPRPPQAPGRSLSFYVKAAAGVVTFFATVIGVVIAIQSRPGPYTLADWSTKANAVCEKDFSQQNIPLLQSVLALQGLLAGNHHSQAEDNRAVVGIYGYADAFRRLIGDLRAVQVPGGASGEINQMLNRGENVFDHLSKTASDLQNGLDPAVSTTAQMQSLHKALTGLQEVMRKVLPPWGRSLKNLRLSQCQY